MAKGKVSTFTKIFDGDCPIDEGTIAVVVDRIIDCAENRAEWYESTITGLLAMVEKLSNR